MNAFPSSSRLVPPEEPPGGGVPLDLQRLFEAAPACLLVLAPDAPRFTILGATDGYLRATKTRREAILGRGVFEVFPDNPDDPVTRAVEHARASFQRVVDLRRSDAMGLRRHDIRLPESEGGGFEERFWDPVNYPVLGVDGAVAYIIHRVEDVTEKVRLQEDGTAQVAAQFALRDSRRAAINLMEDALEARRQAEQASESLRQEIVERRRAEEETREGRAKLEAALASMTDAVFISDLQGRFVDFNDAFVTFHRFTSKDECSKLFAEYPEILEVLMPDGSPAPLEMWAVPRALRGETASNAEYTLRRKDTGETWVGSYSFGPIRDKDGAIVGSVVVGRDITDRKRAEETLLEAKEQLELRVQERTVELTRALQALRQTGAYTRSLIEASLDPLVTIGRDGKITDVNAATEKATGRTRQELFGVEFSTCFTEPERARIGFQRVFDEGSVRDYPLEILHQNGRTIPVLYNAALYRGEAGQVVGIFAAARDITERKRAEQALREANEQLASRAAQLRALAGELTLAEQRERRRLARVLHDHLQQLLVGAKLRAAILGRTGDEAVMNGAAEIESLLDESINASRSLTAELSPPILHEAGLSSSLGWLARWMADKHGLAVDLVMEPDLPPLVEDVKVLLFEAVRELLFNAVKHARVKSATVDVRLFEGTALRISVSDEGPGLDPAGLKPAGTAGGGFGLFSIRERLGLIGGRLDIDSAPGKGSRFVLLAPVEEAEVAAPPEAAPAPAPDPRLQAVPAAGRGAMIRVLLADDHAVMRQGLASLLGAEQDITVVGEASDGQEAVLLAGALLPDVILMDMSMPKLSGVEATRAIHELYPGIRVIGLTMFEEAEHAEAMRAAGAVLFLTKSGPARNLIAAVRDCMLRDGPG